MTWQWARSTAWSLNCWEDADKKPKTSGNSTENLKSKCNNFEAKWEQKQLRAEKSIWRALRQPPKRQLQWQKPQRSLVVRRASDVVTITLCHLLSRI